MHICVIGTGAAGWISAFMLKTLHFVDQVTIIGSLSIPTVGVGESTTARFTDFLHTMHNDGYNMFQLLCDIDASAKYGVYYKNWSNSDFLHAFVGGDDNNENGYLLGNLKEKQNPNHYMMSLFDEIVNDNYFVFDSDAQRYTFHFDANKLISSIENHAAKSKEITHLKDTVTGCEWTDTKEKKIKSLTLENNGDFTADYYVNCIGQTAFNQKVFDELYHDYSSILLTNKAVFYPLQYNNKREEFHPYTIAKTMKYGWRWITPTWSRIGTGYVFSDRHITVDEAKQELKNDIGDNTIDPFEVDFFPRRVDKVFKENYCTIGMAAGFLEPLDAPGLDLTLEYLRLLFKILKNKSTIKESNDSSSLDYNLWACFILHQYKTCYRNDTQFWIDQKEVKYDVYDKVINYLFHDDSNSDGIKLKEPYMFYNTTAGKGIRWDVKGYDILSKLKGLNKPTKQATNLQDMTQSKKESAFNHFDFFSQLHKSKNQIRR